MSINLLMPALSPTMDEGTLTKWFVKVGDDVEAGDLLAEIETDKAVMEFEAVDDGTIEEILVEEGTEGIKVNAPIAVLSGEGEASPATEPPVAVPRIEVPASPEPVLQKAVEDLGNGAVKPAESASADKQRVFASPLARRIARKASLNLESIRGSGPHGRIVKADVEREIAAARARPAWQHDSSAVSSPLSDADTSAGTDTIEIPLDGMRKIIAARLTEAKQKVPHFYLRRSVLMDELLDLRSRVNAELEEQQIKISVNDFIIRASALALKEIAEANSTWAGDRILRLQQSDVAVAVAVKGGLFTPVIRNAATKSLQAISFEMRDYVSRAQKRALKPEEYTGGAFAISNLGMYGIEEFDAVINPPQGSILAVGAARKAPFVTPGGELAIASTMKLTLSVDHRVIDGALGARFLGAIVSNLERPLRLLL